jgi:hypothetical protein
MDRLSSALCLAIVKQYRSCDDALERCVSAFFQSCPDDVRYPVEHVSQRFQQLLSNQQLAVRVVDLTDDNGQTQQRQQQGHGASVNAVSTTAAAAKRKSLSTTGRASERISNGTRTEEVDGDGDHLSTTSLDVLSALVAVRIQKQRQRQFDEDAARSRRISAGRKQKYQDGARWLYVCLVSSVRQSVLPVLITAIAVGYATSTSSHYVHMTTTHAHDWYQEATRFAAECVASVWSSVLPGNRPF